jgi:hypothetical protein
MRSPRPDVLERFAQRAEQEAQRRWFDGRDRDLYEEACLELRRLGEEAHRQRIAELPILVCLYGPLPEVQAREEARERARERRRRLWAAGSLRAASRKRGCDERRYV